MYLSFLRSRVYIQLSGLSDLSGVILSILSHTYISITLITKPKLYSLTTLIEASLKAESRQIDMI